MPTYLCKACGTQYPPSDAPPGACPICEDPRQYVPHDTGQVWLTLDELRDEHEADIRDDHGILGIGCTPRFAIGQRALLVKSARRQRALGLHARTSTTRSSSASRPRAGSRDRDLASALLHDDGRMGARVRVPDPDPRVRPEVGAAARSGDSLLGRRDDTTSAAALTLIRCGGHYDGGQVLHWRDRRALLTGDIVQVIPDRRYVCFMYSYPNADPAAGRRRCEAIAAALEPFAVRHDLRRVVGPRRRGATGQASFGGASTATSGGHRARARLVAAARAGRRSGRRKPIAIAGSAGRPLRSSQTVSAIVPPSAATSATQVA